MTTYDAIVIGAGHNGLVTACYLAKAGLKTLVVEKNDWIGGAAVSRSLYPNFTYSNCSYVSSLLRPEIMRDLELPKHGLQILPYEGGAVFTRDGDYLAMYRNHEANRREFARFSKRDAEAYDRYSRDIMRHCRFIRPLLMRTPPDPTSFKPRDLQELLFIGRKFWDLTENEMYEMVRFWTMSISDYLDEYFETDVIKAYLAVSAIIGTALGPMSPGSAYVLLHHYMGDVDGNIGAWGFARGGMGAITQAMAKSLAAAGGEIRVGKGVDHVLVENSKPLSGAAQARSMQGGVVVSIDTPSGVAGDTGEVLGESAFHAALTVTFHRRKAAHVLYPGKNLCGEVVVAGIGLGATLGRLFVNHSPLWAGRFPWPRSDSHKHARGRLAVVSGGPWNTGAARLAARGGLRIGAGLVTLLSPPDALASNASHLEAIMLRPFDGEAELIRAADDADAAVIGPAAGVGPNTAGELMALARTGAALVVDADALTSFRDDPSRLFGALDRDDVLTPHPGEFERLFPGLLAESPERIAAAREASRRAGAIVLLKGGDTVIAAPDGRAAVNVNGSPWLATAGSGDVLAGFIGGLMAQGMESFEAACAGAWIHAECAAAFGPGLIAEDLPDLAPDVLRRLHQAIS